MEKLVPVVSLSKLLVLLQIEDKEAQEKALCVPYGVFCDE